MAKKLSLEKKIAIGVASVIGIAGVAGTILGLVRASENKPMVDFGNDTVQEDVLDETPDDTVTDETPEDTGVEEGTTAQALSYQVDGQTFKMKI